MPERPRTKAPPEAPRPIRAEALLLPLAFLAGVGVAELFGAANLGVAFGVGQICFAAAVVWLILRP